VRTTIDGLRLRQRPGLTSNVVAGLLPLGAELGVVLGPLLVESQGWFLVVDADAADPEFQEGWIASGFEPEPFLAATGAALDPNPYLAAFAATGDAQFGPIEIVDEHHAIRWSALDPDRVRCQFDVLLEPPTGEAVRVIRATIGTDVVPGVLLPGFLASRPELRGQLFLDVISDCAWTLALVRLPEPTPEPSATETPQGAP
jgi:hypothetical protein